MVKRSALSHNAGFDALNCPTMKKTPALTDAEINEIDELLAAVPAPFETVDAVILDGYLAGVLLSPRPIGPERWMPGVWSAHGDEIGFGSGSGAGFGSAGGSGSFGGAGLSTSGDGAGGGGVSATGGTAGATGACGAGAAG